MAKLKKVKIPIELLRETKSEMLFYIPERFQNAFRTLGISKVKVSLSFYRYRGDGNEK